MMICELFAIKLLTWELRGKHMNCVRVQYLLANNRRIIKSFAVCIISSLLVLTACSENISTDSDPEHSVAFDNTTNISANAIVENEPNGSIVSPPADITVNLGEQVYFAGSGFDPTANYPLSYHWNFGGIQPNGLTQNPGYVTMNTLGTHRVFLTTTNALGISDSTPEVRIIQVIDPNSPSAPNLPGDLTPIASIDSPIGDLNINVGDTVNFLGSGSSSTSNTLLSYFWNFAGAIPNTTIQNPGSVTFSQAGIYPISLSVTDSSGVKSTNIAQVTITVGAVGITNNAPVAMILSPPGDLSINAGDSIYFTGSANDVDSNTPLSYNWDFAGAVPNRFESTPGKVMFPAPGIYLVKLTVTDALGLSDPNPPVRIITVADVSVQNDMPLQDVIISPATDITINLGDTINFQGEGSNGNIVEPLRYLWHFEGIGMPPSTVQNPGDITFTQVGKFEAELVIADANGSVISHEAERNITVVDPNALLVHIHEPATHQTINVGDSISFIPMIINDPLGSTTYNYQWQFDGAAADSMMEIPDPVIFTTTGTYKIKLTIRDPLTNRMAKAETRIITVIDPDALQARIITPQNNQTINIGDTLDFAGEGIDPLGTAVLEYMWKFDGVVPDMAVQNPGTITFGTTGKYRIQFQVFDPLTLRRERSNNIMVTVKDPNALMAEITSPISDMLIYLGESINYMGMGNDPLNTDTLFMYHWDFGRGITSTEQNPGELTYDMPGDYEVEFRVNDPLTNRRSHKVEREIHVMPIAAPSSVVSTVKGTITAPLSDMTILAGDVVVFESSGFDPTGGALMFHWNFDGAALNTTAQNPGAVMFNMPGVYTISLTVTNTLGEVDPSPPSVSITVM